jgi:hypothetical protein
VWAPTYGQTRQELLAARDADWESVNFFDPRVILDGRSLGGVDDSLRFSDVYRVPLEEGNFLQSVDPGVPGDQTRVASVGWFVRLRPLSPGRHTLVLAARNGGDGGIIFHIKVGRKGRHCGRDHGGRATGAGTRRTNRVNRDFR